MGVRSSLTLLGLILSVGTSCVTRDPFAVNASCPADAPCFLSVVAPRGQTAAPGPFSIVAEVSGPHGVEGVGVVVSLNGAVSQDLRLARMTNADTVWGVPDLQATSVDPPEARQMAELLAGLQPGDEVSFLLWAWDQQGNITQWTGDADAGSVIFRVVDAQTGSSLMDAGMVSGDAASGMDGSTGQDAGPGDAGVAPPVSDVGTPVLVDAG